MLANAIPLHDLLQSLQALESRFLINARDSVERIKRGGEKCSIQSEKKLKQIASKQNTGVISSIEFLRALACLMVIYCHLAGRPLIIFHEQWLPVELVTNYLVAPLSIIQNFGFLGVALFFLISGFIVMHTGLNETRISFFIKRVFRIYPALFATVGATILLVKYAESVGWADPAIGVGYSHGWLSALGMEAGIADKALLNVSWTISIELFFYAHMLLLLPLLKKHYRVGTLALLGVSVVLAHAQYWFPAFPRIVSQQTTWIPIFVIGMAIYLHWSERISLKSAVAIGVLAWISLIFNMQANHASKISGLSSHTTQVAYALFIFLATLWFYTAKKIQNPAVIRFFADISYSLYLIHLPFGVAVTLVVYPLFGVTWAIAASFVVSVVMSYTMYVLIEKPGQQLGRKLLMIRPKQAVSVEN